MNLKELRQYISFNHATIVQLDAASCVDRNVLSVANAIYISNVTKQFAEIQRLMRKYHGKNGRQLELPELPSLVALKDHLEKDRAAQAVAEAAKVKAKMVVIILQAKAAVAR